jgi:hypothetical protein
MHVIRASDHSLVKTLSPGHWMQANLVAAPTGERVFLTQSPRFVAVDTASFTERESTEFPNRAIYDARENGLCTSAG